MNSENETLRALLRQLRGMINCTPENDLERVPVWISTKHPVIERIDAALSQQAEPKCERCKDTGEMDSGGVQPWGEAILVPCDCNAEPVEPAPAQDEREEVVVVGYAYALASGAYSQYPGEDWLPLMTVAQHERIVDQLTRPAHTEQQPENSCEHSEHIRPADRICIECGERVEPAELQPAAATDGTSKDYAYDVLDRHLRNTLDDDLYADYSALLDDVFAAPIAQTELVEALRVAVQYLESNKLNSIGSGSAIHRTMEAALAAQGGRDDQPSCKGCGVKGWTGNCAECMPW